jgi:hypothetical protein
MRWPIWVLVLVVLACLGIRFTSLETIPGPPYIDEAATAANAMCLAQEGTSSFGDRWPLFVEVLVGNWEPPMIAYPTALIARVSDGSIGSLRLFPAAVVLGIAIAVFLLGQELANRRAGLFAALLVLLAPWSFMAGRLLWKCPLAPLFVTLGVYAFLRGMRTRSAATVMLSALAFALALYSYQSSWAQVPLLIAFLVMLAWHYHRDRLSLHLAVFIPTLLIACTPLIVLLLGGGLMKRAADVSVFTDGYLWGVLRFGWNYLMHLNPSFLYLSGDDNLRHGVGAFGLLGWVDLLAVAIGAWALWKARSWCVAHGRLAVVAAAGILTGIVTGAMTNEGIPHGLRANGTWPFFALLGAWLLSQALDERRVNAAVAVVAGTFIVAFAHHHYNVFPEQAREYFSPEVQALLKSNSPERWKELALHTDAPVAHYNLMQHAGMSCTEARRFIAASRSH